MKRMSLILGAMVVGVTALAGCSETAQPKTSSTKAALTVQGSVSSKLGTDNARAVAIGENGKKVWTYLDKHGDFSLKLPTGQAYRVVIANQLAGGGQKVIGKLKVKDGATASDIIAAKKAGKLNLGVLRKPNLDAKTTTTTKSLHISCGCDEDGTGDGADWGTDDKGGAGGDWGTDDKGGAGGDWGTDDGSDWGGKGGWEDSYDDGGWDDSKGGWDDGAMDGTEADHADDGDCFDDAGGKVFGEDDGNMDGADGKVGMDDTDFDPCDICVAGDPIDLEPSKGGFSDYLATDAKLSKFEGKACSTADAKTADPAADKSADEAIAKKGLAADDKAIESKKDIGEKCQSKSECSAENTCIAGKVVKK